MTRGRLFIGVVLALAVPILLAGSRPPPADPIAPRYLYTTLEGTSSGLWSSTGPRRLAQIPHRDGYGIKARLSPDGSRLAYTLWPPGDATTPAELWVMRLEDGESRRLLAGVDLPNPPLWSPEGEHLVVRRSTPVALTPGLGVRASSGSGASPWSEDRLAYTLLLVEQSDGRVTHLLPEATVQGMYPFAWGDALYYAVIDRGTDVFRLEPSSGRVKHLLRASEGIARDFRFAGQRMLYNEVTAWGLAPRETRLCMAADCPQPPTLRGHEQMASRLGGDSLDGVKGEAAGHRDPSDPVRLSLPPGAEFIGWLP